MRKQIEVPNDDGKIHFKICSICSLANAIAIAVQFIHVSVGMFMCLFRICHWFDIYGADCRLNTTENSHVNS